MTVQDKGHANGFTLEELSKCKNFSKALATQGGAIQDVWRLRSHLDELIRPLLAGVPPPRPLEPALLQKLHVPSGSRCLYTCNAKCQSTGEVLPQPGTVYVFDTVLCFTRTFWQDLASPVCILWRHAERVVKNASPLLDITSVAVGCAADGRRASRTISPPDLRSIAAVCAHTLGLAPTDPSQRPKDVAKDHAHHLRPGPV